MRSVAVFVIVFMLWVVGLLAFAARVERLTPAAEPERAEAIVVLTGAATVRITAAVKLLELGKGRRLLVSGVNPEVKPKELQNVSKATAGLYDCCIDMGLQATDTKGNAREIEAWARRHSYTRLIVVTADYHMPRAMLELRGAMPHAGLAAYPVKTAEIDASGWWRTTKGARGMALEYCKYLAILGREWFLTLGPDERPSVPTAVTSLEPAR